MEFVYVKFVFLLYFLKFVIVVVDIIFENDDLIYFFFFEYIESDVYLYIVFIKEELFKYNGEDVSVFLIV